MRKDGPKAYFGMGAVSVTVVIVVLAIACFSVLTFVSANSDYKLSVKSANALALYYAADTEAARIEAELKTALASDNLTQKAAELNCTLGEKDGYPYIAYTVAVSENKYLDVVLKITDNNGVEIQKWQTVTKTQ